MKTATVILFAITINCTGRVISPFPGWDSLLRFSTDIVVVHCEKPASHSPPVFIENGPHSDYVAEVCSILKGESHTNSVELWTDYQLSQDENYLIFGYFDGKKYNGKFKGLYTAYEDYRVVPLGKVFSTNSISGKPFDEQLQTLFQMRAEHLNQQIKSEQEEKARLEEWLGK